MTQQSRLAWGRPLRDAEKTLRDSGADTLAVLTDVAEWESVKALADQAFAHFGAVHVLCNNAGVSGGWGPVWEKSLEDWYWLINVNLWGVIHGVRAFLPRMIEQETEGHVVNTGSVAGLTVGWGIYGVSKYAVVSLSETLHQQLAEAKTQVGVSILCPGVVATKLAFSERNRPAALSVGTSDEGQPSQFARTLAAMDIPESTMADSLDASEVAESVLDGIRERKLYVIPTQPIFEEQIRERAEQITRDIPAST